MDFATRAVQRVVLGNTGIEVSRMAIGTGTKVLAKDSLQTRTLGIKGLADLLVYAYEKGITFFDVADEYGSHPATCEALKRIPRGDVVVTTKSTAQTEKDMRNDLDRFRRELGTDYIDILLLHCMMETHWSTRLRPLMDVLSEAKRKGIIRAHGASNHHFGALTTAAAEPWVDVVLVRINEAGISMEGSPEQILGVIRQMKMSGKGLYGMKVMGEGALGKDPRRAIEYQVTVPVDAFVIGMESRRQIDDNIGFLDELTAVKVSR